MFLCDRALFNAAFLSCWSELNESQQDELVLVIETALQSPDVPAEVTHTLLNLAEFMEHTEKVMTWQKFVTDILHTTYIDILRHLVVPNVDEIYRNIIENFQV